MEFFESIQTFIIYTRSEGFKEIAGTKINDEIFAHKDEGKTLHPEARWHLSDINSGLGLPDLEQPTDLLRFATLKDCKDWVKNMPEDYKQKIAEVKTKPGYAEVCQKLADFRANSVKTESFNFMEAFEALDDIYSEETDQISLFDL